MAIKNAAKSKAPVRNLDTFRETHDSKVRTPIKIRDALKRMRAEYGDSWYMYEHKNPAGAPESPTFAAYSTVGSNLLDSQRTAFKEYIVRTKDNANSPRYVWFATPAAATAARGRAATDADFL